MAHDEGWWLFLPRPLRNLPADLAATAILTGLTILVVVLPGVKETPLRIVFGLPFVLFLPGYAFIAALFPEAGESPPDQESEEENAEADSGRGIDGIERVALSFGLSIAIVPLIGLVLNFTPWGIRLTPILVSVSGFTLIATAVAAHRRWQLPADEQFHVPYEAWIAGARSELFEPEDRTDAALNVLLVLSLLLALGSVGYAVTVPKSGEQFTEFYYLTEDEDGELVAANYPTEFQIGESKPVIVGVSNQEHQPVNYTWVAKLQDVRVENNSTTVLAEEELGRQRFRLEHNETQHTEFSIRPTFTGTRLRVAFLLYKDVPPANPTVENAYRETHLWINVTEG